MVANCGGQPFGEKRRDGHRHHRAKPPTRLLITFEYRWI
jgi:hypothetical protein